MTSAGSWGANGHEGSADDYAVREPGARRKKLAGYLKAANELRQTYQQTYMQTWAGTDGYDDNGSMPGAFRDASTASSRSGDEEMLIFPSYARRHIKIKVCNTFTTSRADY